MDGWSAIAKEYDPIKVGSIDATDSEPHDKGIVRALRASYKPYLHEANDPEKTIFIGRLNHDTSEDSLRDMFETSGKISKIRLVRDIVTSFSKGYAFIEYVDRHDAREAIRRMNHRLIDDRKVIVMFQCERSLPGWVPRRLGGGFGGRKESGQLRFGGDERPWRRPIMATMKAPEKSKKEDDKDNCNNNVEEFENDIHKYETKREARHKDVNERRRHETRCDVDDSKKRKRGRSREREGMRCKERKKSRSREKEGMGSKERKKSRSREKEGMRCKERKKSRSKGRRCKERSSKSNKIKLNKSKKREISKERKKRSKGRKMSDSRDHSHQGRSHDGGNEWRERTDEKSERMNEKSKRMNEKSERRKENVINFEVSEISNTNSTNNSKAKKVVRSQLSLSPEDS